MTALPPRDIPVVIAGAGIGGLAVALALAGHGVASTLLERRSEPGEAGAGIQIGPNGVHILGALGVADPLAPMAGQPQAIDIRDGRSGRVMACLPLGAEIEARLGAPYWTAHRADLHAALLAKVKATAEIELITGFPVDDIAQAGSEGVVEAIAADGRRARGCAVIGADGLWSTTRRHVRGDESPAAQPRFTGRRAYRAVIPATEAPATLDAATRTNLWLAPGSHVVHYPVRGGRDIALVVIVTETTPSPGWATVASADEVRRHGLRFPAPLRDLLSVAPSWGAWGLHEVTPLHTWTRGPVALLGDAAHPMLPFLAQGAVMALEDAVVLADCLARARCDGLGIARAFAGYEAQRRSRVGRVVTAASRNGTIYHLSGPAAFARDLVLRATPGPRLLAGYDWLYGWRVGE